MSVLRKMSHQACIASGTNHGNPSVAKPEVQEELRSFDLSNIARLRQHIKNTFPSLRSDPAGGRRLKVGPGPVGLIASGTEDILSHRGKASLQSGYRRCPPSRRSATYEDGPVARTRLIPSQPQLMQSRLWAKKKSDLRNDLNLTQFQNLRVSIVRYSTPFFLHSTYCCESGVGSKGKATGRSFAKFEKLMA